MGLSNWMRPPRHLLAIFAGVTLVPAALLVWLGWEVLEQDRRLDGQNAQERVEAAEARIADGLLRQLRLTSDRLVQWTAQPPPDLATEALVARLGPHGVEQRAGAPLVFVPRSPDAAEDPTTVWSAGERLEDAKDLAGAAREFQSLAASSNPSVRAGALIRLAGNLRKMGRGVDALVAYRSASALRGVRLMDEPVDLVARAAECQTLSELGRRGDAAGAATVLANDMARGRWLIDRATYEFRRDQLRRLAPVPDDAESVSLADAIFGFWRDWSAARPPGVSGFESLWKNGRTVLLMWRTDQTGAVFALAASPAFIEREWRSQWASEPVDIALVDAAGHPVVGAVPASDEDYGVVRQPSETGLPWTLRVGARIPAAERSATAWRRSLLATVLCVLVVLIPAGGFVVARAVQRELGVARLQADFVSAVSHEFRTPLTAMAHLTDRLQRDESMSSERRRQYYDALARDTHRLRRFVDTLLDFGRMEAGAAPTKLEPVDVSAVVSQIVQEFRRDPAAGRHAVEFRPSGPLPLVPLDREAFGVALWNLLDNAAKYSPADAPIDIDLTRDGDRAVVRVRDHGIGVPASEQKRIFRKFVRGVDQHASGVRGTGVGLAMVDQIAKAHGGEVLLESEVGRGSTFSLVLPTAKGRA
jgi:two-component system phosphate regulon sensor histidine kinase PhoR